ncbi:hypothetical protein R3P38DRAFT_3222827 [Favolaschia claudopus]|uniref:DUF6534 domain-containing protein n=1 Tax=Favolaschia claudopus TaxID=2862362 RepID=A0AAV9ZXV9_9AGAR
MYHLFTSRATLVPLDNTVGVSLIGLILSSILFGVTCLQIYLYFTRYSSRDQVALKLFVVLLLIMDSLHLAFISHAFYRIVVSNFGDYAALGQPPWTLLVQVVLGVTVATMVQLFYAWRIYRLSKGVIIPVLAAICALVSFALSALYTHKALTQPFSTTSVTGKVTYNNTVFSATGLGFLMASDIIVACAMLYHLSRSKSEFQGTKKALNTLVAYFVSSGALTTLFAIGDLVAEAVSPSTLYEAPFFFILIRLHCLSFMSILNSRDHVRNQLHMSGHAMVTMPSSYHTATDTESGMNPVAETKTMESRVTAFSDARQVGSFEGMGSKR